MEPLNAAHLNHLYLQAVEQLRKTEQILRRINEGAARLPAPPVADQDFLQVLDRFLSTPHREVFAAIGKVGEIEAPKLWRYPEIQEALIAYLGDSADEGHLHRVLADLAEWGLIDTRARVPELGETVSVVRFTAVGQRLYAALMGEPPRRFVTEAPPPITVAESGSGDASAPAPEPRAETPTDPGTAPDTNSGSHAEKQVPAPASQPAPAPASGSGTATEQKPAPAAGAQGRGAGALTIPALTEDQKLALKALGMSGYSRVAELVRFPTIMEAFIQGGQVRDDLFSLRINELKRMRLIFTHPRISTGVRGHSYAPIELTDLGREAFRHYFGREPVPSEIPSLENRFKSLEFAYFVRDVYRAIKEKGWTASMDQDDTLVTLPVQPPPGRSAYTIRVSIVSRNGPKTFYHKCFMTVPEDKPFFSFLTRYRILTREFYMICPNQALVERLIESFERWARQAKPELLKGLEANFTTLEGLKKEKPWTRLTYDDKGARVNA